MAQKEEPIFPHPARVEPREAHYAICSPWQVYAYEDQITEKERFLSGLFTPFGMSGVKVRPAEERFGFRTKVEWSFQDRSVPLSLAYHVRGGKAERVPLLKGCVLASDAMNRVGLAAMAYLRDSGVRAAQVKGLVVREGKRSGDLFLNLYVKDEKWTLPCAKEFMNIPGITGARISYSLYKSPASIETRLMEEAGRQELTEVVLGKTVRYPWNGFFQNHVPMFEVALEAMRPWLAKGKILELYGGVGTIGVALGLPDVTLAEIVPEAVEYAKLNAEHAGMKGYSASAIPSENLPEDIFAGVDTIVLDPPRAGLHPKVIANLLRSSIPRIVYLSCNPETQARDLQLLTERYAVVEATGFDLYPNTPHVECLAILERK